MSEAPALGFELREKCLALQQTILDRHPRLPILLREIHTTLSKYPEQVTLMTEDEIAIVVSGLKVQTGVEFAAAATKSAPTKALKAKLNSTDAF